MSYSADATLANDATFQPRIRMAIVKAAIQIASEAATSKPLVDIKRNSLATQVLNSPDAFLTRFVAAAIEANALTLASVDANIDVAISSVWNDIAGVTQRDLV